MFSKPLLFTKKIKRELEKAEILGYSEDEVRQQALKKLRELIISRETRLIELQEEIVRLSFNSRTNSKPKMIEEGINS